MRGLIVLESIFQIPPHYVFSFLWRSMPISEIFLLSSHFGAQHSKLFIGLFQKQILWLGIKISNTGTSQGYDFIQLNQYEEGVLHVANNEVSMLHA